MKESFTKIKISRKGIALTIIMFFIASSFAGYLYIQKQLIVQPLNIGERVPRAVVQTLEGKDVSTRSHTLPKCGMRAASGYGLVKENSL